MCGIAKCSHKQAPASTTIYRSGKDDMSYTGHINTGKGWVAYTIRVSASRSILVMAQATDTAQSLSVDTKDWSIFSMNAIHAAWISRRAKGDSNGRVVLVGTVFVVFSLCILLALVRHNSRCFALWFVLRPFDDIVI